MNLNPRCTADRFVAAVAAVSHGPTRRLRRVLATGAMPPGLLRAADHEADLLGHPYTGLDRVELARLRLAGRVEDRQRLLATLPPGVSSRWWRPLGLRSALRRRRRAETAAAQAAARARDTSRAQAAEQQDYDNC